MVSVRFASRRAATLALVFVALFVAIAPAATLAAGSGGATYQPDGRVSEPCHPELEDCTTVWFGNDIYNTTASGQVGRYADYPNFFDVVPVVFRIKIQNDGNAIDRFSVSATGRTEGYTVRFFHGTTDITRLVKTGTYRTPFLAPGARYVIKARVKPNVPSDGDKTTRLVTITSGADPTTKDAVKLVRSYVEFTCGC